MRLRTVCCLLALLGASLAPLSPSAVRGGGAGKGDADGWVDLTPGPDLKGWKRVPIAPDTKLSAKNPWKLDSKSKTLYCDGVGVKEILLNERIWKDGTFHVEWRFAKVEGKTDYNSGIYVRTSGDGKVWHQAQVAHVKEPAAMADLFGNTLVDGKPARFLVRGDGPKLVHAPGEWNTYDITCKGRFVTVRVNGKKATAWDDCRVPAGNVGLQAEYYVIEFKDLRFQRDGGAPPGGK